MNKEIHNIKDALEWLKNHPYKNLYDEYDNYYSYASHSNQIEYYYKLDEWNYDFERISEKEFLNLEKSDFYFNEIEYGSI